MTKPLAIVAGVLGTGLVLVSVVGVGAINAATNPSTLQGTIFQQVVDKLKLNTTPEILQSTLQSTTSEVRTNEINTEIDQAVKDNKLTAAEGTLAKKLIVEREKLRDANQATRDNLLNLSESERRLEMDKLRVEHEKQIASTLGVTVTELDTLKEKLRDAGIHMGMGKGLGMGMRDGMGRGRMN